MDTYFERFGGVRDYLRRVVDEARATGYTETLFGRRRYLPDLNSDNRQRREMAERMALNAPIQGTAADIVKIAMLNVDRALREAELTSRMLLQVHDEIVLEIAPGEREQAEELVRREMADAVQLRAPLDVSVGCGDRTGSRRRTDLGGEGNDKLPDVRGAGTSRVPAPVIPGSGHPRGPQEGAPGGCMASGCGHGYTHASPPYRIDRRRTPLGVARTGPRLRARRQHAPYPRRYHPLSLPS